MLKNATIRKKLVLFGTLAVTIMVIIGIIGIVGMRSLDKGSSNAINDYLLPNADLQTVQSNLLCIGNNYLLILEEKDNTTVDKRLEEITGWTTEDKELLAGVEELGLEGQRLDLYNQLQANLTNYRATRALMDEELANFNYPAAKEYYVQFDKERVAVDDCIKQLVVVSADTANGIQADNQKSYKTKIFTLIIILVLALALLVFIEFALIKSIRKGLTKAIETADELAQGKVNLNIEADEGAQDEIGSLMYSFSQLVDNSKAQAAALNNIAAGNIDIELNVRSDEDVLNIAMEKVVKTLGALEASLMDVTAHFVEGNTHYQADASQFEGAYSKILTATNQLVAEIMAKVNALAENITLLGEGNLPEIDNNYLGDYAVIFDKLIATVESIRNVVNDTDMMASAALAGDYGVRADISKYQGDYKNLVDGINKTLDMVVEKTNWYVDIIDAMPISIQAMDVNGNWTLINKKLVAEMSKALGNINREDFYGKPVKVGDLDLNGIERFKRGEAVYHFSFGPAILEQTSAELTDVNGNVVGYVGAILDRSAVIKVADYTDAAVERLQYNLNNLAAGSFNFRDNDIESNQYTEATEAKFMAIDAAVDQVTAAVGALVNDSMSVASAAIAGDLSKRADVTVHSGEFAKVMKGLNDTLDAVATPIQEINSVLADVAQGKLSATVTGNYQGTYLEMKNALNGTVGALQTIVSEISDVLSAIGEGDLTVETSNNFNGDFLEIKKAMNDIIRELSDVMTKINQASEQVASGSRQLSEGAQMLADGSTKQASAVQELSSTIGHVADQTRQNTEDARKASTMSTDVMHMAEQGNSQMKDMLKSMDEINESSANISKIIKVIDDIAFQTNILALNAAVEAARAGVHGKGFAVVADEVRNLAAKSAQAASETTALIEGSISKVEEGTTIAKKTAEALGEIVEGITETSNLCDKIAEVSDGQAKGIDEVNSGIEQVNQVVQSNSATAQQSAASSEELYGQADSLKNLVSRFKLDAGAASASYDAAPARIAAPKETTDIPEIILGDDFDDKY